MVLNLFFCMYLNKKANKMKNSSQTNYKDIPNETRKEKKKGIYVASKIFPQTSRLGLHSQQSTVK